MTSERIELGGGWYLRPGTDEELGLGLADDDLFCLCDPYDKSKAHWLSRFDAHAFAAALQQPQAPAAGEWQPIKTAPRDGTDFLGLIPFQKKHHQMVGCFAPNGKFMSWPGRQSYVPTHWMPLPAAPTPDQGSAG